MPDLQRDGGTVRENHERNLPGWFGLWGQVKYAIRTVGGDFDDDGEPVVTGVAFFLGIRDDMNDAAVRGEAKYYVNGEPQSLPWLMNSTSYGVRNAHIF
jgi:hypothetical protein